jgi:hypothetical protein
MGVEERREGRAAHQGGGDALAADRQPHRIRRQVRRHARPVPEPEPEPEPERPVRVAQQGAQSAQPPLRPAHPPPVVVHAGL